MACLFHDRQMTPCLSTPARTRLGFEDRHANRLTQAVDFSTATVPEVEAGLGRFGLSSFTT
jgi:hypothetical protein